MAGLHFGTSTWDNIPQTLGLSVVGGVMKGLRQGTPVQAYEGKVRDRETSASVVVKEGEVMTFVHVETPLPPGSRLSLTRQKNGFWAKLFRGQDIIVGDPAFDAAFVIKGEPEEFVRAALTPSAREQIMELTHSGASITLEGGKLAAWTNQLLTNREHLDALMKASFSAAEALCSPEAPLASPTPYR